MQGGVIVVDIFLGFFETIHMSAKTIFVLQDSCARMLLFRGCDKECLNYAGQTAYQVEKLLLL